MKLICLSGSVYSDQTVICFFIKLPLKLHPDEKHIYLKKRKQSPSRDSASMRIQVQSSQWINNTQQLVEVNN